MEQINIAENLARVRERIAAACAAGLTDLGENRIQEAVAKIEAVAALGARPRWHLVGHLQRNKAQTARRLFAIIHSVDSLRIAEALGTYATSPVPVLLQVNVAGEASKFGFRPEEVAAARDAVAALPNIDVRGLMTIAPMTADLESIRPVFRRLRELRDGLGLHELSMGMTDDFEVAIEEGATLVRVGRAIFGPRGE